MRLEILAVVYSKRLLKYNQDMNDDYDVVLWFTASACSSTINLPQRKTEATLWFTASACSSTIVPSKTLASDWAVVYSKRLLKYNLASRRRVFRNAVVYSKRLLKYNK